LTLHLVIGFQVKNKAIAGAIPGFFTSTGGFMFAKIRQYFAWQAEIKALDQQIKPERPKLGEPDQSTPGRAVWRLPVPGKPDAYMATTRGGADYDLFVVPVSGKAFNRLWLCGGPQSQERPDGCRLRAEMTHDTKFHHAAAGFAEGERNPVPLARVSLDRVNGDTTVRFSDGVTRTLWLLAHNVAAFPVVIAGERAANELAALAGADRAPMRVSELFARAAQPVTASKQTDTKREAAGQGEQRERPESAAKAPRRRSRGQGEGLD
jgi:hypothetical protein